MPLKLRQILSELNDHPVHVYFPESGIVSLVVVLHGGQEIETGIIGRDGMVGAETLLGTSGAAQRSIVQVAGEALRLPSAAFVGCLDTSPATRAAFGDYLRLLIRLITQSVACNGAHTLIERCARWLLTVSDRVDPGEIALTHEFIATMLGVRRAGVTVALGSLASAGLLTHGHGRIQILDKPGLEAVACECYRATQWRSAVASG